MLQSVDCIRNAIVTLILLEHVPNFHPSHYLWFKSVIKVTLKFVYCDNGRRTDMAFDCSHCQAVVLALLNIRVVLPDNLV